MPNLNRRDDLVVYHNRMNTFSFAGLTSAEFSVFAAVCCHVKNKETETVVFTFEELRDIAGLSKHYSSEDLGNLYLDLSRKLLTRIYSVSVEGDGKGSTIFATFDVDQDAETVTVVVAERAAWLFNRLENNFTTFHLASYTPIDSKYAKSLYRQLRQFRSTGYCFITAETLREVLGIPKTYKTGMIMKGIITPSVNELGKYFENLKVEVVTDNKRGHKVRLYKFSFTAHAEAKKPEYIKTPATKVSKVIESVNTPDEKTLRRETSVSAKFDDAAQVVENAVIAPVSEYPMVPKYVSDMNNAIADAYAPTNVAGVLAGCHYSNTKNSFCNYEQHNYDFGELEKHLLAH